MDKTLSKIMKLFLSLLMVISVLHLPSIRVSDVFANTDETPVEGTVPETETITETTEEDDVVVLGQAPAEEAGVVEYETAIDDITVKATVKEGTFAEEVELIVDPIYDNTQEYSDAEDALNEEGVEYDGMIAFDIYFRVTATGERIEPDGNVDIEFSLNEKALEAIDADADPESVSVTHITEDNKVELVADVSDETEGTVEVSATEEKIESVDASFTVESFSTFTVTWRTGNAQRRATIHYVDTNGNELTVSKGAVTDLTAGSASPVYLKYDIEGYDYAYTYRNTNTNANRVMPYLSKNNNNYWRYRTTGGTNTEMSNGDNIYVVYTPKVEPTSGGTAKPVESSDTPDTPDILKESTDNGDGTRTLSLSITGKTIPLEVEKLADVIVVFDISGSMNDDMDGNSTNVQANRRLTIAKNAVNALADDLYDLKNSSGQPLIRMGLVSFSNSSSVVQGLTDNAGTFKSAVNGLTATGGTNWEAALSDANHIAVDPDRATFVIFVTDGNPTFRNSRMVDTNPEVNTNDGNYYLNYLVYGTGTNDTGSYNYNAALTEAQSIVSHNKALYTIGISNNVTNLTNFAEAAGAAGHYTATQAEDVVAAFEEIKASIMGTLGWNADLVDGITELTNLEAKAPIVGVDLESFTYYKNNAEWDPTSEGANEATYENGAVEWNLGENFQLENGVTYRVEFTVWPAQEAIDIVTDLNNGVIEFDDLDEDVQKQIAKVGDTYTLKTNTETAYASYQLVQKVGDTTTTIGDPVTQEFQTVDPLIMDTMTLKVAKIFTDTLTQAEDRETQVTLFLQRREVIDAKNEVYGEWEDFAVPYTNPQGARVVSNQIVLSDANGWEAEFYISPGLETDHDGVITVYDQGYQFRLTEPNQDYHYELNSEIVRPMLKNLV